MSSTVAVVRNTPPVDVRSASLSLYSCPICFDLMREPIQTSCGHRFCRECFLESNRRNGNSVICPMDNTTAESYFDDVAFKREIRSLRVNCTVDSSCVWIGEFGDLDDHIKACSFMKIKCSNSLCKVELRRSEMGDHLLVCPYRRILCQFCHRMYHLLFRCEAFPLQCDKCHQYTDTRSGLTRHKDALLGECPESIIRCPLYASGCQSQFPRRCIDLHLNDFHGTHDDRQSNGIEYNNSEHENLRFTTLSPMGYQRAIVIPNGTIVHAQRSLLGRLNDGFSMRRTLQYLHRNQCLRRG